MPGAEEIAAAQFERHLKYNTYPGRGLVVGRSSMDASWVIVYWIMGRSARSRNRRLMAQGSTLRTEPVDPRLVDDPSLIIYEAMLDLPYTYLVGNGDQVRTAYDALCAGGSFEAALATREHEHDAPHNTPRISALLETRTPSGRLTLSMLKANPADPHLTDRFFYRLATPPTGFGVGLTTYRGDGEPLPAFEGDPLLLPCRGSVEAILDTYWQALDADNRIAIAVKHIPEGGHPGRLIIHNRFAD